MQTMNRQVVIIINLTLMLIIISIIITTEAGTAIEAGRRLRLFLTSRALMYVNSLFHVIA